MIQKAEVKKDFIQELEDIKFVPDYYLNFGFDHFSPSQDNKPLDNWFFEYAVKDQEWRRKKKIPNPNMIAGNAVQGDKERLITTQDGNEIMIDAWGLGGWIFHDFSKAKAIESALAYMDERKLLYEGKDLLHFFEIKERIPQCINNALKAFDIIKLKKEKNITTEKYCTYQHEDIEIVTIGRTDIASDHNVFEFKTKWFSKGPELKDKKTKKPNGKIGFRSRAIPKEPDFSHLVQVAFYWKALGLEPTIIYFTGNKEDDFRIFNGDNCDLLNQKSLEKYIQYSRGVQLRRQNLLKISSDPKEIAQYIQPDFSSFYWNDLTEEQMEEVHELWGM